MKGCLGQFSGLGRASDNKQGNPGVELHGPKSMRLLQFQNLKSRRFLSGSPTKGPSLSPRFTLESEPLDKGRPGKFPENETKRGSPPQKKFYD